MASRNEGRTQNERGDSWYRCGDYVCITPGEGDGDTNLDVNDVLALLWMITAEKDNG